MNVICDIDKVIYNCDKVIYDCDKKVPWAEVDFEFLLFFFCFLSLGHLMKDEKQATVKSWQQLPQTSPAHQHVGTVKNKQMGHF